MIIKETVEVEKEYIIMVAPVEVGKQVIAKHPDVIELVAGTGDYCSVEAMREHYEEAASDNKERWRRATVNALADIHREAKLKLNAIAAARKWKQRALDSADCVERLEARLEGKLDPPSKPANLGKRCGTCRHCAGVGKTGGIWDCSKRGGMTFTSVGGNCPDYEPVTTAEPTACYVPVAPPALAELKQIGLYAYDERLRDHGFRVAADILEWAAALTEAPQELPDIEHVLGLLRGIKDNREHLAWKHITDSLPKEWLDLIDNYEPQPESKPHPLDSLLKESCNELKDCSADLDILWGKLCMTIEYVRDNVPPRGES
jgi:hypothetical protein